MRHSGRRPHHHALTGRALLLAHHKITYAFDDEVELVLLVVGVALLFLPRLEAVEAEHEPPALEQRGLELLIPVEADVGAIVGEVTH